MVPPSAPPKSQRVSPVSFSYMLAHPLPSDSHVSFVFHQNTEKKARRVPIEIRAKDELIAVLQSEVKILRQANSLQWQEVAKLKQVIAAQDIERKAMLSELADLKGSKKKCGNHDEDESV